jgi:hypothetical protein
MGDYPLMFFLAAHAAAGLNLGSVIASVIGS